MNAATAAAAVVERLLPAAIADGRAALARYNEILTDWETANAAADAERRDLAPSEYQAHDDAQVDALGTAVDALQKIVTAVDTPPADGDYHEHRIEDTAKVYLRWGADDRWVVDHVTVDGHALDSALDEPESSNCGCPAGPDGGDGPEHLAAHERAALTGLPTGEELLHLLAAACGKQVI